MDVRPGYKQTEIGTIPQDWNVSQLKELAKISSGATPARSFHNRYFRDGSIPWVKTMDLNNGKITATSELVTELAIDETSLTPFSFRNSSDRHVWRFSTNWTDWFACHAGNSEPGD